MRRHSALLLLFLSFPVFGALSLDLETPELNLPSLPDKGPFRDAFNAYKNQRYDVAERLAKEAVDGGVADAYFILGWLHEKGLGRPVNLNAAQQYYRKGHEKGFEMTTLRYGILQINATGENQDERRERGRLILSQLDKGPVDIAQLVLGKAHAMGFLGTPPDFGKAMSHLDQAIEKKNAEAMLFKASLLEGQYQFEKTDHPAAIELIEKAAALEYENATIAAGAKRLNGHSSIIDEKKGLAWLTPLARSGNAAANYHLGHHYLKQAGQTEKALKHLTLAADNQSSAAHVLLAMMYQHGKGVEASEEKMIVHFERATQLGEPTAAHQLARLYLSKKDPAARSLNIKKGYHYLSQAAPHLPEAQTELGILYLSGQLGAEDATAAFAWFNRAAQSGHAVAQNNLASLYETGNGISRDLTRAFQLYSMAAKQGQTSALVAMGRMMATGAGTEKNPPLAWAYLSLAAESKDKEALRLLNQLSSQLSGKELRKANEELASLKKSSSEK